MGLQTKCAGLLVASATALFGAGPAHAGYTRMFGEDLNFSSATPLAQTPNSDTARNLFLSKLTSPGTENFESQQVGAAAPLTLSFPGSGSNLLSAELTGTNGSVRSVIPGTTDGNGRYSVPSTTSQFWEASAGPSDRPSGFIVTLGQPIAAFGFYGIDIGDFGGQLQLVLSNGDVLTVPNIQGSGGSTNGSVLFFGLIADSPAELFSSVQFRMSYSEGDVDVFAFDNFVIADLGQVGPPTVPEPGTLALLAGALLALGSATRLQRRS